LAVLDASLAISFVGATPTEQATPISSRTSRRIRWPIAGGVPNSRTAPATSRNASSSAIGSTSGVTDRRISRKRLECARYDSKSGGRKTASGHSRRARTEGIALRIPNRRASYEADITTPREPAPPTTTGRPTSDGSF
jgi:hypothetical protein